jgi:hypothetical protein
MAYVQALSIKATQRTTKSYAVLLDKPTYDQLRDEHFDVFDYVILLDEDAAELDKWKLANEWKVWQYTPFKETIKLESDLIVPASIDHWWSILRQHDVVVTTNVVDFRGQVSDSTAYRRTVVENHLVNAYNGVSYFRYSAASKSFFETVRYVFENWEVVKAQLALCNDTQPTTDVAYSIAALFAGEESTTLPTNTVPSMVHMKPAINKFPETYKWHECLPYTIDSRGLIVGGYLQTLPFHYYEKQFDLQRVHDYYKEEVLRARVQ